MRFIVRRLCIGLVVMVTGLGLIPGLPAQVQEEGDGPAVAMGNGRMVRGTVTAVTSEHITLKTEQEGTYQVVLTPNTRLRKGRDALKVADVHIGDGVGAMGVVDEPKKTVHALFVGVMDAEQIRKGREAMGKTFIWGRVTAINELKLTLLREDGVSQVIAVDEDTSFKRGRGRVGADAVPTDAAESITLGDVKVGDTVAGPGALKAGLFVPTQLLVGREGVGRRRRGTEGAPAGNGTGLPGGPQ